MIDITTEQENEKALKQVEYLMSLKELSLKEHQLLNDLVSEIQKFEEEHYRMDMSTPSSRLIHLMEAQDVRHPELAPIFGSGDLALEAIAGKKEITQSEAEALGEFFNVEASLFI